MYKIIIQEMEPQEEGNRYVTSKDIYEQVVETIDIPAIVAIVNKIGQ